MSLCQRGTQRYGWIVNAWGATTTYKYLEILNYEDGCLSCELQSTLRHALSCFMYPQGRCVYVPTRDPMSHTDFEQGDELWTHVTTAIKF